MNQEKHTYQTPIGILELVFEEENLTKIRYTADAVHDDVRDSSSRLFREVTDQLDAYFSGTLERFDLPLAPHGTDFQQRVWTELTKIPYGSSITYGELAKRLGDPRVIRAAGRANGQNPIPILIPCHRVIGSDDSLVGYAGGVEKKRWLLQHEGALLL